MGFWPTEPNRVLAEGRHHLEMVEGEDWSEQEGGQIRRMRDSG